MTDSRDAPPEVSPETAGQTPSLVSAREAMGAEQGDEGSTSTPRVTIEVDGVEWTVRVRGRGVTGLPMDPSAPLLFLTFAQVADEAAPVLEALTVVRDVEELGHDALVELHRGATPFRDQWTGSELFPETRRGKKRPRR